METRRHKILITDDSELNRAILCGMLSDEFDILEASGGNETMKLIEQHGHEIDLLLLDIIMPDMDGFEVLRRLSLDHWLPELPVIMISSETGSAYMEKAFLMGASDYISRPFMPSIVYRRIMNTITLYAKQKTMMRIMTNQIIEKEKNNDMMVSILSHIVESRNGESRLHVMHINALTRMLYSRLLRKNTYYHLDPDDLSVVRMASSLHDIGKMTIPESILNKPGRLTNEEYEVMKTHSAAGAAIIDQLPLYNREKFFLYSRQICRSHHERWDGRGYPDGLKGDEIPIAAQIVSIADVYDALVSKRCYKGAFTHAKAMDMILKGECGAFNPVLLECLRDADMEGDLPGILSDEILPYEENLNPRAVASQLAFDAEAACDMTRIQLENEHLKHHSMMTLGDDLWIEYTSRPSSLSLSHKAQEVLGLPALLPEPMSNAQFLGICDEKNLEEIKTEIAKANFENPVIEKELLLNLNGVQKWFRAVITCIWNGNQPSSQFSCLILLKDIDESVRALHELQERIDRGAAEDNFALNHIAELKKIHDEVRIVEPFQCMELSIGENGQCITKPDHCYARWGHPGHCEDCVCKLVTHSHRQISKLEVANGELFSVLASYCEIDGKPFVLELINRIERSGLFSKLEENSVLQRMMINNRKMYLDSITGVFNRRYYDDKLRDETGEYAFALLDLDRFRLVNESYGHDAGDIALYEVGQAILSSVSQTDDVVRYGSDEFLILMRDVSENELPQILEKVRAQIEKIQIEQYPDLHLTASIGGVYKRDRVSKMLRFADIALYLAKEKHNQVNIYQDLCIRG